MEGVEDLTLRKSMSRAVACAGSRLLALVWPKRWGGETWCKATGNMLLHMVEGAMDCVPQNYVMTARVPLAVMTVTVPLAISSATVPLAIMTVMVLLPLLIIVVVRVALNGMMSHITS